MSRVESNTATGTTRMARFLGVGTGWLLLYASGPGILGPNGSPWGALLGVAVWALFASRPGRWAFRIEWLLAGAAWCGICSWAAMVHWSSLLFIGPGFGIYYACAGGLLRRLARHFPLALAAPAAWMFIETVRTLLEPPFGLSWMRLGIHAHDTSWLAGSARVWGVFGISYALAAAAGGLADLVRARELAAPEARARRRFAAIAGGGPLLLMVVLSLATSAPATERGPRVLLVQPGIAQERKMEPSTAIERFRESIDVTLRGQEEAEHAGEPPIDLVAWGESMLPITLMDPALHEAIRRGALPPPWSNLKDVDEDFLTGWEKVEDQWVRHGLLHAPNSEPGLLPPGAAFVSGALLLIARDGVVGKVGGVVLWGADGKRGPTVGKMHLVPGAETMLGLERYEWVRKTIFSVARYVPDLLGHLGSRTLRFTNRNGREYVLGASVCFDNAFDGPFVEPLLEGPLDFHLVTSNEAWFKGDQENDQMMAFSHLAAIETGRSIVRATNSGVTAVVGPTGDEVARLRVDGRDREVAGTLRADVPVPVADERGRATVYVRTWRVWPVLLLLLAPALFLLARRRRAGYPAATPG